MKKSAIFLFALFLIPFYTYALTVQDYLDILKPLTEDNQWQAAEKIIDNALKEHQDSVTVYVYAGWILRELKKFDKALAAVEPALKKFADSDELKNELCYIETGYSWHLIDQKKNAEALIHAEKAYKINQNSESAVNAYGYSLLLAKRFDEANAVLSKGLKLYPGSKYLLSTLTYSLHEQANDYYNKKNTAEYINTVLKAYELSPDSDYIINLLGVCYIRIKEYEKAVETFKTGISRFPEYKWYMDNLSWAYSEYADVMKDKNRLDDYYALKKAAFDNTPDKDWVINDYAVSLIIKKDYDNAVRILNEGILKFPGYKWFKNSLAWAYAEYANQLKEKDDLENFFKYKKLAYETSPDADWVINDYAVSLIIKKDYDNALKIFYDGIKKFPSYKHYRENLAWAYSDYAEHSKKNNKPDDYYKYAKLCFDALPDRDWTLNLYAVSLIEKKDFENAVRLLKDGLVKYPGYKWFKDNLSWAYREYASYFDKKGDYKNAVYYYKLDFTNNPDADYSIIGYGWELCKAQRYLDLKKEIKDHLLYIKNKIDKAQAFEEIKIYLSTFQELILIIRDEKFFYEYYPVLEKRYPDEDSALIWIGGIMSYLNNVSGNIKTDIRDKAVNYVKKGMDVYEKKNPGRPVIKDLYFPVKGQTMTVSEFDDPEAVTHNGYLKYCYDFMSVDDKGSTVKPGTNGSRNEDYYCFGMPVYAASDGIIEGAEDDAADLSVNKPGYYGNHLGIRTADGFLIWYEHLKYKSIKVKNGDKVAKGQLIAEIGNTGYSFSPHLHFGIFDKDYISVKFYFEKLEVRDNGNVIPNDGMLKRKMTVIKR